METEPSSACAELQSVVVEFHRPTRPGPSELDPAVRDALSACPELQEPYRRALQKLTDGRADLDNDLNQPQALGAAIVDLYARGHLSPGLLRRFDGAVAGALEDPLLALCIGNGMLDVLHERSIDFDSFHENLTPVAGYAYDEAVANLSAMLGFPEPRCRRHGGPDPSAS